MLGGSLERTKPVPESGVQPHILVVDDARDIREPLVRYLKESGYRASAADGAQAARRLMRTAGIDLVILDIMMPGEDGLSLCRSIRETSGIPVIMLTARGEELDRIVGLEVGADDYVAKPFNPRELLARIGAVLRRTNTLPPRLRGPTAERYRFGEWTFNAAQREIAGPEGIALPLSSGEFKLLMAFLERPQVALSREQLLDPTKGRDAAVATLSANLFHYSLSVSPPFSAHEMSAEEKQMATDLSDAERVNKLSPARVRLTEPNIAGFNNNGAAFEITQPFPSGDGWLTARFVRPQPPSPAPDILI